MKKIVGLSLGLLAPTFAAPALAEPPNLQTPSPVIYLAHNLDETDMLGWCIDTLGRGLSDQLQAHSCKPQGGDVQFRFDAATGQISSVAFANLCASYTGTLPLGLVTCNEEPSQAFAYDDATMTFRLENDRDACLVVGASSRSAGPYLSRTLEIANCDQTNDTLKMWVVKP